MKINNTCRWVSVGVLVSFMMVLGCGKSSTSNVDDSVGDAVESAVTMVGGLADELTSGGFSTSLFSVADPRVVIKAACSGRAAGQNCSGDVKTLSYPDCTLGNSVYTLTGSVTLTYSSGSACSALVMSTDDSVTRTYDLTVTGPRGGTLHRFTTNHTDYRGNSISGGGKLTKTSSGYNMEVLGNTRVLTYNSTSLFDISARTTSPIAVTGGLLRSVRVLNGGALEVIHNLAKYTATWVPSNVTWSAGCCYPTSGSATVTFEGSITGSATVSFSGCGTASVTKDGTTKDFTMSNCE